MAACAAAGVATAVGAGDAVDAGTDWWVDGTVAVVDGTGTGEGVGPATGTGTCAVGGATAAGGGTGLGGVAFGGGGGTSAFGARGCAGTRGVGDTAGAGAGMGGRSAWAFGADCRRSASRVVKRTCMGAGGGVMGARPRLSTAQASMPCSAKAAATLGADGLSAGTTPPADDDNVDIPPVYGAHGRTRLGGAPTKRLACDVCPTHGKITA